MLNVKNIIVTAGAAVVLWSERTQDADGSGDAGGDLFTVKSPR